MADTTGEGIITESDRRFLADPDSFAENHTRQAVHQRRRMIRERVEGAVADLILLADRADRPRVCINHSGHFDGYVKDSMTC